MISKDEQIEVLTEWCERLLAYTVKASQGNNINECVIPGEQVAKHARDVLDALKQEQEQSA